jgi:hypothetical protein
LFARVGETKVCTSIIVACVLRYGAEKKCSPQPTAQLEEILAAMTVLPLDGDADRHYGSIRADLERRGTPIGANDLAHRESCPLTRVDAGDGRSERNRAGRETDARELALIELERTRAAILPLAAVSWPSEVAVRRPRRAETAW